MSETYSNQWDMMLVPVQCSLKRNVIRNMQENNAIRFQNWALWHTSTSPMLAKWWTDSSSSSLTASSSPPSSLPRSPPTGRLASPGIPTPMACPSLLRTAGSFQYLQVHCTDNCEKWTDAAQTYLQDCRENFTILYWRQPTWSVPQFTQQEWVQSQPWVQIN